MSNEQRSHAQNDAPHTLVDSVTAMSLIDEPSEMNKYHTFNLDEKTVVITFGTFDLFHVGHLRILQRAKALGDILVVGVSSDELNYEKKMKHTIYSYGERKNIVQSIKCVDYVFKEESLDLKARYLKDYRAKIFVMGDDWENKFDYLSNICMVKYLPRTPSISTTSIVDTISARSRNQEETG
jgi:glycerol-3-phosphate cytidylyltransferase